MAPLLELLQEAEKEAISSLASEDTLPITPLNEQVSYVKWARQVRKELKKQDVWYVIQAKSQQDAASACTKRTENIIATVLKDHATAAEIIQGYMGGECIVRFGNAGGPDARLLWESLRKEYSCPSCTYKDSVLSVQSYRSTSLRCVYCKLLLEAINQIYPGWVSGPARAEMKLIYICDMRLSCRSQPYIQLQLAGENLNKIALYDIEIRFETDDNLTWYADPRGSLSRPEWEEAISQIKECVTYHPTCRTPNPLFVPKRLVQVEGTDSGIRVVERDWVDCPKYCSLSYCWGSQSNTLTTRKENLEKHRKGISLSLVPQTIQDAIIICRSLDISYLWVDPLCIVQNDDLERDWYEQSGEMCDIYSNAYLVIAADASPSSNFGFLPGRDHIDKQWKKVRVHQSLNHTLNDHQITASIRAHKQNTLVSYSRIAWDGKSGSPLLDRGWAFQERLLANRLLRFTSHGIEWECNKIHQGRLGLMSRTIRIAKLARIDPRVKEGTLTPTRVGEEDEVRSRHLADFLGQNTPDSIYLAWHDIVSYYSEKELTRITDKLSALSGLARLVSESLSVKPEAYLAGHWRDDLNPSLLWHVTAPKVPNRSLTYRAPTWSWASTNGRIGYFHEQYQFRFESCLTIHDAHCDASHLDPFGHVTSGKLVVTGLLAIVSLHVSLQKPEKTPYTGFDGCAVQPFENRFFWVSVPPTMTDQEETDPTIHCEVLLDDDVRPDLIPSSNLACLLIGRHCDDWTDGHRAWWLVLKRVSYEDSWQRIGIGYFHEYTRALGLFLQAEKRMVTLI